MKTITRDNCVISNNKDLEFLHSLKHFPVFVGCVEQSLKDDLFADMNWYISKGTGCIQLNPLLPLKVVYQAQHNDSVGSLWKKHHQSFAAFMQQFKCKNFLEIGGAHGRLPQEYKMLDGNIKWKLVEPNPKIPDDLPIKVIPCFFDQGFKYDASSLDALVHSHVLEHAYIPGDFLKKIFDIVPLGKWQFFSIPNLAELLKKKYTNAINFEHTVYLTEPHIDYLLLKNGFEIVKKEYFDGHSIFYATRRAANENKVNVPNLYDVNKQTFESFIDYHEKLIKKFNDNIESTHYPVYLFGAHIFSQYLIAFGLKTAKIISILDNSDFKIGRRLYGTSLFVDSPKALRGKGKVNVILKVAGYNEEIKTDIINNINPNVTFWE